MARIPHLLIPGPWVSDSLAIDDKKSHHLAKVLRVAEGEPVTYTDGQGSWGQGTWQGAAIDRGPEQSTTRPTPHIVVAVATPHVRERARFLVEKLAELGVDRLVWLRTQHTEGRPPRSEKAQMWADAALEQSRGVWQLEIEGPTSIGELPGDVRVAGKEGGPLVGPFTDSLTIVVGPEGGLEESEFSPGSDIVGLGPTILRSETAALAAATILLRETGRWYNLKVHSP